MGEQIRYSVRERYLDLMDWIDIRPDLNWKGWCLGGIALIALFGHILPSGMIVIAGVMGTLAALGLFVLLVVGALTAVVLAAIVEVARKWFAHRPQPKHFPPRRLQFH